MYRLLHFKMPQFNKQNLALHAIVFSYDETIKDAKHVSIKNAPKLFLAAPFPLQLLESA